MSDHCKACGCKYLSEEYNLGDSNGCYHCGADYVSSDDETIVMDRSQLDRLILELSLL